jgi:hypothetical protein
MDKRLEEMAGRSIIILAKEHKNNCHSEDCGVTMYPLGVLVTKLLDRPLTRDEIVIFI